MHAALPLHLRVNPLALDDGDHLFIAAHAGFGHRQYLDLPAVLLGKALVHAEDLGGKERGLIAAGAGADFQDYILLVVGVCGQEQHLDLFFQSRLTRRERGDFFLGHGAQLRVGLGEHGAGLGQPLAHLLQFAELHDRGLQVTKSFSGLVVLFAVVDHLGQGKLRGELFVALLHLFQTIDHGKTSLARLKFTGAPWAHFLELLGDKSEKGGKRVSAAGAARAGPEWADGEPLRFLF